MQNEISVNSYSVVKAKQVDWLWYPYIAYGKITVLQGDPGDGKSTFILELVGLLTKGYPLPGGGKASKPIKVIYQCLEDNPEDTIKPRLIKAGADCDKVFFFPENPELTLSDERLENTIRELGVKLVIFDPFQSFMPKDADFTNAVKMRSALSPLAKAAERCKCAVVLIGHMNKDLGGKNIYRGLGSIDIAAIARSILMISRNDENPSFRIMSQIKNNLGPEGLDISFEFSKEGFVWHGALPRKQEKLEDQSLSQGDRAKETIKSLLAGNDLKATEVMEHAEMLGLAERTVKRAKKDLHIKTYKKGNAWYWHLPESVAKKQKE